MGRDEGKIEPPFQTEAKCKPFILKFLHANQTYIHMNSWFCTEPRFEKKTKSNSEMDYFPAVPSHDPICA